MRTVSSDIIHAQDLTEFEKAIRSAGSSTLVVFDIDEVIFTSQDQILHPNYKNFRDIIEQDLAKNLSEKEMVELISLAYKARKRVIVDPKILEIFKLLLSQNTMTVALTHCVTGDTGLGDKYEELRIAQLESFNVDFSKLSQSISDISLPELEQDYGVPLLYKGVILTGLVDKGTVLKHILSKIDFKPEEIIFIDDRIDNIESVQVMCLELGIKYTGFEYNAVKNTPITAFNEQRARFQFKTLAEKRIWLNDDAADADIALGKST